MGFRLLGLEFGAMFGILLDENVDFYEIPILTVFILNLQYV